MEVGVAGGVLKTPTPTKLSPGGKRVSAMPDNEIQPQRLRQHRELSPTQLRILDLAGRGYELSETAVELHSSAKAVSRQRSHILDILGAANMTHAIAIAYARSLLPLKDEPES